MKIAYFHRLTFEETEQRFKEEAEKIVIELTFIKYKQLVLESDSTINQYTNKPIEDSRQAEFISASTNVNNEILKQVQDDPSTGSGQAQDKLRAGSGSGKLRTGSGSGKLRNQSDGGER